MNLVLFFVFSLCLGILDVKDRVYCTCLKWNVMSGLDRLGTVEVGWA